MTPEAPACSSAPESPVQRLKPPATQREAFVLIYSILALTFVYFHGAPRSLPQTPALFAWFGINFVVLFALPALLLRFWLGVPLSQLGLRWGEAKVWSRYFLVFLAVMLPVVLFISRTPEFQAFYPRCDLARSSTLWVFLSAGGWLVYFFAWEWMFRGMLLFSLEKRVGGGLAILLQMIPFTMMHYPKPEAEAWSAIIAGLALGLMALRGRSFLGTWLLHWLVATLMDLSVILWPLA